MPCRAWPSGSTRHLRRSPCVSYASRHPVQWVACKGTVPLKKGQSSLRLRLPRVKGEIAEAVFLANLDNLGERREWRVLIGPHDHYRRQIVRVGEVGIAL